MRKEPLSHEAYRILEKKFYTHSTRMIWAIVFGNILLIAGSQTPFRVFSGISGILSGILGLIIWGKTSFTYFREKYRQGYKIGPWEDIPRKGSRKD